MIVDLKTIPMEVYYFCVFPILFIVLLNFILLIVVRKRGNNKFKLNYLFQISGLMITSIMLPLVIGYTASTIYSLYLNGVIMSNIVYLIIGIFVSLVMITVFIWVSLKAHHEIFIDEDDIQENDYDYETE